MIVSNSAGTKDDPEGKQAKLLEQATGVKVFKHSTKKPGCGPDVFKHLQNISEIRVKHPNQIAVIGDRLFTDVIMANAMGSWSIWIRDGVVEDSGIVSGNSSPYSGLKSGAHDNVVVENRKRPVGISDATRVQDSNPKERLIDRLWIVISVSVP